MYISCYYRPVNDYCGDLAIFNTKAAADEHAIAVAMRNNVTCDGEDIALVLKERYNLTYVCKYFSGTIIEETSNPDSIYPYLISNAETSEIVELNYIVHRDVIFASELLDKKIWEFVRNRWAEYFPGRDCRYNDTDIDDFFDKSPFDYDYVKKLYRFIPAPTYE
jgi:hypothetical protein